MMRKWLQNNADLIVLALTVWLLYASVAGGQQVDSRQPVKLAAASIPTDTARTVRDAPTSKGAADPVETATREYRTTGIARTVAEGNFRTFPYGHSQPTLTCSVLRACIIELQAGEVVLSRISGDTERWEIAAAAAGIDGRTTLVVVKPRDCDITTNLVLATDRRLYDLTLDAPPCKGKGVNATNPQQPYARHVRFYYPDETIAQWSKPQPVRIGADVTTLNFRYRISKDKRFPWMPAQVFDDGAHVYVTLPDEARHAEAPVLFVLSGDGSRTLLNYNVAGDTYVTDRLFDRAVLVAGVDGKEQKVLIERQDGGRR
jgi:type IV secretion system protein VirB9